MCVLNLSYGSNPGCVVRESTGGTPGQCGADEAAAVPHRYTHPRPHRARLYVCQRHAREIPEAEPLTAEDRKTVADRRARRDEQLRPHRERMRQSQDAGVNPTG